MDKYLYNNFPESFKFKVNKMAHKLKHKSFREKYLKCHDFADKYSAATGKSQERYLILTLAYDLAIHST